jgi:hypothetical protein
MNWLNKTLVAAAWAGFILVMYLVAWRWNGTQSENVTGLWFLGLVGFWFLLIAISVTWGDDDE